MPRKKFRAPGKRVLITRWTHVIRVLKGLSPHEKENHFNMGTFAYKTECGTVACAAGHCGLDPWFRARGLKTVFQRGHSSGDSVGSWENFFGETGTRIFMCVSPRSVDDVISEIREHIKWLKKNYDPAVEFPSHFE